MSQQNCANGAIKPFEKSTEAPVIGMRDLTKRYGDFPALDHLSLTVPRGMIYGFLGPNGAGKTTTIRILLGFIRATSGHAAIQGHDVWRSGVAARRDLGYLVIPEALYPDMSGLAQLDHAAKLSGQAPVLRDQFLDALDLSPDVLKRRLGTFSKGMKQKLALTAAFQTDPTLLILDEPTDGLDPLVQRRFEDLLRERRDAGRTIFMSSHDLAEVERVCQRVAIVRKGKLVAEESIENLTRRRLRTVELTFIASTPAGLSLIPNVTMLDERGGRIRLTVEGDLNPLLRLIGDHPVSDMTVNPPRLEDVFFGFYDREGSASGGARPNGMMNAVDADNHVVSAGASSERFS